MPTDLDTLRRLLARLSDNDEMIVEVPAEQFPDLLKDAALGQQVKGMRETIEDAIQALRWGAEREIADQLVKLLALIDQERT